MAQELGKPLIVEEAGYGLAFGGDRSPKAREDMAIWFGKGSRGYMPWGFMATGNDIGDGDRDSGLDRTLHGDWDPLFSLFRSQAEALAQEVANLVLPPPANRSVPDTSTVSVVEEPVGVFQVNQTVFSTEWLNIRRTPGFVNKLGDDVLGMVAPAQPALITGAAVVADGLTWWPVHVTLDGGLTVDGWAAEANATMRLLSSQQVRPRGAAGLGGRRRGRGARRGASEVLYTQNYVNLRRTPGYVGKASEDVQGVIPFGAQVEVLGAAVMADEVAWRPVRAPLLDNAVATGWAAESSGSGEPLLATTPPPAPVTNVGGVIGAPFQPGTEVKLLAVTNLLSAAALSTKAAATVASLLPNGKVTVVAGPEMRGDLEWWQTRQDSATGSGALAGWAALTSDDGLRLLAASSIAEQIHVAMPFVEPWEMTQGWAGNAQIYSQILYDNVPLKGHNGLDFGTPINTPLLATDSGTVLRVGYEEEGFGHFVVLQHSWGESLYAHLEKIEVLQGASLARGQQLGLSGNTGFTFGPHLHFGVRITPYRRTDGWGGFVNPLPFLGLDAAAIPRGRESRYVDRWRELVGWVRP